MVGAPASVRPAGPDRLWTEQQSPVVSGFPRSVIAMSLFPTSDEVPFVFGAYASQLDQPEVPATPEREPLDDAHECDGDCFRAAAS